MATQMKAIVRSSPGPASVLQLAELPVPALENPHDILVKVRGVSINPADTKVRGAAAFPNGVLGWDAAGVVEQAGEKALFKKGDEVMYAGTVGRAGTNSQYHVVDSRIAGRKPKGWEFADSAGLPLVALTAWEMLEDQFNLKPHAAPAKEETLLIINGAGGVGTIATQLAAKVFNVKNIVATASRPETVEWVKKNGATHVISHREDLAAQLKAQDLTPSLVFICYDPLPYVPQLATVVRPFGRIGSIVESQEAVPIHLGGLFGAFGRSLSFHWECMFTRSMHGYDLEAQGRILNEVAKLAEEGKLTSLTTVKEVFSVRSLRKAHETIDSGKAIGKIVFEVKDTIEEN
ncbi:zinc-binding alcohol dehydrogenase [Gloeophyllum trabeum ATCC 11539]|uniref:Zinc-binding alcohol dehydrogenase n=1 Tax=Gloeophyllum trabeum (strain ATCC 11539 / FP-39264 / Madison 617) TaxID=670483 RepID=S7QLK5_GLOTA|nr:zinc-binding alcohol dehydrogenase [Gloeophyllum trabeum ATCC 11539]EPQ60268.1 zinc-binding alcohol dehydrogenase [Gloeophyllum trabeum ATCC 11539]